MIGAITAGLFGTPTAPVTNSYESIATFTAAGGESSFTFSSIPSTYKHLQLRLVGKSAANVSGGTDFGIRFNNDSGANYKGHQLYGEGTTASSEVTNGTTNGYISWVPKLVYTNVFAGYIVDILDYQNTNKNTTVRSLGGWDANGTGFAIYRSVLWNSTAAINQIDILQFDAAGFGANSQFALYGIKG